MKFFSKMLVVTLTSLLVIGCQKPKDTPAIPAKSEQAQTNSLTTTVSAPSNISTLSTVSVTTLNQATSIDNKTAATALITPSLTFSLNQLEKIVSQKNPEKLSCLQQTNYDNAINDIQKRFETSLTSDELKTANAFYASEVGKKLVAYAQQQASLQFGGSVSNPILLTNEDNAKVDAFTSSETGKKLYSILYINDRKRMQDEILKPLINIELTRCNLPKFK